MNQPNILKNMSKVSELIGVTDEQFGRFCEGTQTNLIIDLSFDYDPRVLHAIWCYFRLNHPIGQSAGSLDDCRVSYAAICEKYGFTNEMIENILKDRSIYDALVSLFSKCVTSPRQCMMIFYTSYREKMFIAVKSKTDGSEKGGRFATMVSEMPDNELMSIVQLQLVENNQFGKKLCYLLVEV